MPSTQGEALATRGIPARLAFVFAASIVPAALLALTLIGYDYYDRERDRLVRDSMVTARALAAAVDTELSAVRAALLALATSPHLFSGDLAAFHAQAQAALKDQAFANIVLIEDGGRQVLNTLQPFGEALPAQGNPPELQRIFEKGEPVITGLFVGPVVRRPYIAIGVPVRRDAKIRYSLNGGLDPQRLAALLAERRLPPDWIGGIFDTNGTIIARTHDAARLVGQTASPELARRMREVREEAFESRTLEGIPVLTVFSRSPMSDWTVAIGIPTRALTSHLWYSMARLFIAAFVALLTAIGLAALFSRKLLR